MLQADDAAVVGEGDGVGWPAWDTPALVRLGEPLGLEVLAGGHRLARQGPVARRCCTPL